MGFCKRLPESHALKLLSIPKQLVTCVRWLLASDRLPDTHEDAGVPCPRNETFVRWLLSRGELGRNPANADYGAGTPGFLRELLSSERLHTPAPGEADPRVDRRFAFWSWLFKPESLPSASEFPRRVSSTSGFVRWLVAPNHCPQVADSSSSRGGLFGRLLASEECPNVAPDDSPRRVGFFNWLLARESCPDVGPATDKRRAGFARWLLSQEKL